MSVSLHISARLHEDKKSCALTYVDSPGRTPCATELPRLVAIALEAPFQYNEELGTALHQLIDGDGRYLTQARERARHAGEPLLLRLQLDAALQDLPFELLHDGHFLLPNEIHLVRQVGDRGRDRILSPANRPLKLLTAGFVGRRRQLQTGLAVLRHGQKNPAQPKVGVLLHGTAGLGKSCLAGKLIERLSGQDTTLVVVHGRLDAATLLPALQDAFRRWPDAEGEAILAEAKEMPEKLASLAARVWSRRRTLIVLDDFEQNFEKDAAGVPRWIELSNETNPVDSIIQPGVPILSGQVLSHSYPTGVASGRARLVPETAPILLALLRYLPESAGMASLILTSRYSFSLSWGAEDLAATRLHTVELVSFRPVEQRKKLTELKHIATYADPEIRQKLLAGGHGNPRLMEWIDILVGQKQEADIPHLLAAVQGKQEEYVAEYVLEELLATQPAEFRATSVFRIPVKKEGMLVVCNLPLSTDHWSLITGVSLGLLEHDQSTNTLWVTPLLREKLFAELASNEQQGCHAGACHYYREILNPQAPSYFVEAEELIYHALAAGEAELACDEGARLVKRLRESLAYAEAKRVGEKDRGQACLQRAYEIWLKFYGPEHPDTQLARENLQSLG